MKTDIVFDDGTTVDQRTEKAAEQLRFWRRSISKYKWSALGLASVVTLLTALVVYSMTPVYRSTATILIESGKSKVVSIEEVYGGIGGNREYFQTQAEIIKVRELVRRLVERLELAKHPALDPRQRPERFASRWLPAAWFPEKEGPTEREAFDAVVRTIARDLQVQLVRNSHLVRISFDSPDRELAAR